MGINGWKLHLGHKIHVSSTSYVEAHKTHTIFSKIQVVPYLDENDALNRLFVVVQSVTIVRRSY